ncbi:aggregation-promoting factor C-terminal-like domain-containing protein [Subtercola frigoramans]|uniref:Chemotaxis protein histidine kinase CheA n=2 Tax=Subtercola frigoramans TaxID=120298 RepID=A0ABS2L5S2_9MICO|nr:chemotaxis protein histidine kinase CheA [Subtercola frigoramans]
MHSRHTESDQSTATAATSTDTATNRRALRRGVRRFATKKIIIASALVATGILVGSGFLAQSSIASSEKAASSQRTEQALAATVEKSRVVAQAQDTLARADQVVALATAKVDTTTLSTSIASLTNYSALDAPAVTALTVQTEFQAQQVKAAADEADRIAAEAAAAAAEKAEADAQAAAAAAAEALAQTNTVDGAKAAAASIASSQYGWGDSQFSCLASLWQKESGWSYQAYNASSGATGIPQALPGSKMASIGSDWETNATTQIKWGLQYIASSYGTPCSAWSHSQSVNWY